MQKFTGVLAKIDQHLNGGSSRRLTAAHEHMDGTDFTTSSTPAALLLQLN